MEDELDPRYYASTVHKHWKWILVLTLVTTVLAAQASSGGPPPSYEAVATLYMNEAVLRDASSAQDAPEVAESGPAALARLAKNRRVQRQIIQQLGNALPAGLRSVAALDQICSVLAGDTESTIQLTVRYTDRRVAANIANTWATLLIRQAQKRFPSSADDVGRIISLADSPPILQSSRNLAVMAVAGVLTLLAGILSSLVLGYLRQPSQISGTS